MTVDIENPVLKFKKAKSRKRTTEQSQRSSDKRNLERESGMIMGHVAEGRNGGRQRDRKRER